MQKVAIFTIWALFLYSCGGSDGNSDNPPDLEGTYDLTNTECEGSFDTTMTIIQDGDEIIFQATTAGFVDVAGEVNNDGEIDVSSETATCDGQFVDGVITATCNGKGELEGIVCRITYERR